MASVYGYNPPFFGGPQNILSRQEDEQIIKNDILQLLMTLPGERVYNPTFGVNLRNVVFEQLDDELITKLKSEISTQIARFDPRVIVNSVSIDKDEANQLIQVRVALIMRNDPAALINIAFAVGGNNG
jgi:phage baseplate assembly protein W